MLKKAFIGFSVIFFMMTSFSVIAAENGVSANSESKSGSIQSTNNSAVSSPVPTAPAPAGIAMNEIGDLLVKTVGVGIKEKDSNIPFWASIGLEITNKGKEPVRIALMKELSLQFDDGTIFDMRKFSGIANCVDKKIKECEQMSEEFEVIMPGQEIMVNCVFTNASKNLGQLGFARLSGTLFVKNNTTNQSWPANISLKNISVTQNLK